LKSHTECGLPVSGQDELREIQDGTSRTTKTADLTTVPVPR